MKRTDKETFVDAVRERLDRAPVMYITDFSGLNVKSMTTLRQKLRESGAEYLVGKNRLVKLALQDRDMPDLSEALMGPTGVVFGYEDVVGPAKVLSDFAKENNDRPTFKAGVLENKLLDASQIVALAKLPTKDVLLAQLAGALEAPMAAFASVLEAKTQEMSGLLDAYKAQKEAGE